LPDGYVNITVHLLPVGSRSERTNERFMCVCPDVQRISKLASPFESIPVAPLERPSPEAVRHGD
jgi:hypothetical protein